MYVKAKFWLRLIARLVFMVSWEEREAKVNLSFRNSVGFEYNYRGLDLGQLLTPNVFCLFSPLYARCRRFSEFAGLSSWSKNILILLLSPTNLPYRFTRFCQVHHYYESQETPLIPKFGARLRRYAKDPLWLSRFLLWCSWLFFSYPQFLWF